MSKTNLRSDNLFTDYPEYLKDLFVSVEYPWEVLRLIGDYIYKIYKQCLENGFTEYKEGVLVGKFTTIADTACICAPVIIGSNCEIRHCAYIRGNVIIGNNCVIGNSSEIKNSIILSHAQIPHFNYVGDSVIGNHAHLGAAAICSNCKGDKTLISVGAETKIETGLRKFGAVLADNVEIGCGTVLNPGTIIGKNTRIYPLNSVRGVIPDNSILKSSTDIVPIK